MTATEQKDLDELIEIVQFIMDRFHGRTLSTPMITNAITDWEKQKNEQRAS